MQISKLVRNAWLPLLIVAVVVVGGFAVTRVKSFFGAHDTGVMTTPQARRLQAVQTEGRQVRDLRLGRHTPTSTTWISSATAAARWTGRRCRGR